MNKNLSSSMEDYLEKIYDLELRKKVVHAIDIAKELNVKKPSVTSALKKLEEKKFITYERYKPILLTDIGREIAAKIMQKHKIIRDFFQNVLEVEYSLADSMACTIEHLVNDEVINKLSAFELFVNNCTKMNYKWIDEIGRFCGTPNENDCSPCDNNCTGYCESVHHNKK